MAQEKIPSQLRYSGSLPTTVKDDIRNNRVQDQGFLCAYTLRRIDNLGTDPRAPEWDAHVEHVISQTNSEKRGALHETIDYRNNLVACVNKKANLSYGASIKTGDKIITITPFTNNCEAFFTFEADGTVSGTSQDAIDTIEVLQLNHETLVKCRLAAYAREGLLIGRSINRDITRKLPKKKSPSEAAALRLSVEALKPNPRGELMEFCVAISQRCKDYVKLLQKRRQKQKYAA
jgi:uncharacterized protein (TIGR02646 family)